MTSTYSSEVKNGTTTSWLPLKTAYPSISGCADAFYMRYGNIFPVGWDPGYGREVPATAICLPPEVTQWWYGGFYPDQQTKFGIQPIACPAAFTTAIARSLTSMTTFIKCCPSGYTINPDDTGGGAPCVTQITPGQVISFTSQLLSGSWTALNFTVQGASTFGINGLGIEGYNVGGTGSSLSLAESTPSVTLSSVSLTSKGPSSSPPLSITPSSPSSSQVQTPTSTSNNSTEHTNMISRRSIAGIVVGGLVGAMLICFAVLLIIYRRRKLRFWSPASSGWTKPELHATSKRPVQTTSYELPNNQRAELWAQPVELGTR